MKSLFFLLLISCGIQDLNDGGVIVEKDGNAEVTNGKDGRDGKNGPAGNSGANGSDGAQGADGAAGTHGTNGVDGEDGRDGSDGADGAMGRVGPSGPAGERGQRGVDGSNGTRGEDGMDGASCTVGDTEQGGFYIKCEDGTYYEHNPVSQQSNIITVCVRHRLWLNWEQHTGEAEDILAMFFGKSSINTKLGPCKR